MKNVLISVSLFCSFLFIDISSSSQIYNLSSRQSVDPVSVSRNYDISYYRLKLIVKTTPNRLEGSLLFKAVCTAKRVKDVRLDFMRSTMIIDSVIVAGRKAGFRQDSSIFTISLDRTYHTGEIICAEIFYKNAQTWRDWVGHVHFGSLPWIWSTSEPYGARYWWPCNDHPADKADSMDIIVTIDSSLRVGSNGRLVATVDNGNGTTTFHWHEGHPIATYLVSISIGNYVQFSDYFTYSSTDSVQILNYVLPEHIDTARIVLRRAVDGLRIFSRLFGLYPFADEKYGHAEAAGGMEHQTMTSISLFDTNVVIHDLAHQWFGDMITCRSWSDLWLNEGFATYAEALYNGQRYGNSAYWICIDRYANKARHALGSIHVVDTNNVTVLFDGNLVYYKGAMVLHMLRHVLGDSLFFRSMYNYANDPNIKYHTASTKDFQEVCEKTSGEDLGYFFDEWIYGESFPTYTIAWSSVPTYLGYEVSVKIHQDTWVSKPVFFTMPVDIRFIDDSGLDTIVTVQNDAPIQEFHFRLPFKPGSVQLDPGNWILKEMRE